MTPARLRLTLTVGALFVAACGPPKDEVPAELEESPGFRTKIFHLEAPCEVTVDGVGTIDVETDYLPGVIACENGNAPPAALRAQAVQARTFLYYKLFVRGATSVGNSQGSQVYSCDHVPAGPGPEHYAAAEETTGQYLTFENQIIASFYVAGAIPPAPDPGDPWNSCKGNGGEDPTSTENLVTYNRGKSGCDIDMSDQGLVTEDCRDNPHNRGTASQNGQSCLANVGVEYDDMFTMYYGDDIQLVVADGQCGGDPIPDEQTPEEEFCEGRDDGSFCLDASTRIECADGLPSMSEACDFGCGEGACIPEPDMDFCSGRPDGAYCDGSSRVECIGEMISQTAACPGGCTEGVCEATDGGTDDGGGTDGGGGAGSDDDGSRPPGAQLDGNGLPPLVGPSPGVDGGCSTTRGAPDAGWLLAALVFFGARRRR